jgi:multiple sugar transport system substrate-binding protein
MNKSMLQKIFCCAALLALSASLVFAGGGSQSTGTAASGVVTLQVWGGVPAENGPQASVDEFNRLFKDKGIQAEYTRFVNDDNGNLKLETTLLSGDGVDVYMTYSAPTLHKRIESNMALDLTSLIARDTFDIKGLGDMGNTYLFNGRHYGLPTKINVDNCIMINKGMFDAAGIPVPEKWTYSEFREIAKRLTKGSGENKIYGAFLNTQQFIGTTAEFAASAAGGNWIYGPDGKTSAYNSPLVKEAVQLAYDMMNVDKSAPTHVDSVTQKLTQEGMFLSGKCAITIGSWIVRNVKDVKNYPHDFVTAFAPYPVSEIQASPYSIGGAGDIQCINPKSKNVDAAWEYIKWYTTQGMIPMARGGRIPLYNGYSLDEVTSAFMEGGEKVLDFATVKAVLITPRKNVAVQTNTKRAAELQQIFKEELEAIYNNAKTVEQGLADAKARGDKILAE